jgi:hypothetical protein
MTCSGFGDVTSWIASGGCFKARIGLVLLFFLIAIIRKWGAEEWGISYAFGLSMGIGLLSYILLITFIGNIISEIFWHRINIKIVCP